jgi:hypothetical protein
MMVAAPLLQSSSSAQYIPQFTAERAQPCGTPQASTRCAASLMAQQNINYSTAVNLSSTHFRNAETAP